jgi:phosphatidylglycerol:prolipoprotein diacylglycerol transferase
MNLLGFVDNVKSTFSIFGLNISFYGLIISLGILLSAILLSYFVKKRGLDSSMPIDVVLWAIPFAIVGARLYYIAFSGMNFTFLEALEVWNGGLAIYGGVIGGFIGICIYSAIKKFNLLELCDMLVPCLILGQSIGRIGCYFAGCCYGIEVTSPNLMWFPLSVVIDGTWHYATFFYECAYCFLGAILLFFITRNVKANGVSTATYFVFYGICRFLNEAIRGDSLYIGSFKVSQLLSLALVLVGFAIYIYVIIFLNKKLKSSK